MFDVPVISNSTTFVTAPSKSKLPVTVKSCDPVPVTAAIVIVEPSNVLSPPDKCCSSLNNSECLLL